MRRVIPVFLALLCLLLPGCVDKALKRTDMDVRLSVSPAPPKTESVTSGGSGRADSDAGALSHRVAAPAPGPAAERKIIRNAAFTMEIDSPADGQRALAALVQSHDGFIVTSEFQQHDAADHARMPVAVVVTLRVPAAQFSAVVDKIRALGRVQHEKITGQDVTEEYVDLGARIRAKQALEMQFLEIMKQAKKVTDALEVQRQLSEVRTEIERLEGRRRFLADQASFSTITVTLQTPAPAMALTSSGLWGRAKAAFGSGVEAVASILIGMIWLAVVIPVLLLIGFPLAWLLRAAARRWRAARKAGPVAASP